MKLVCDRWKREGINKDMQEIAERAVKIYDKLAAFVEDFIWLGMQLDSASATFKNEEKSCTPAVVMY